MTAEALFQQFSHQLNASSLALLTQHYPEHAYTLFAKAYLAFQEADWAGAVQGFTQAYAADTRLWEALFYKARALEAQYHFVEAALHYEQVLAQQPQQMKVWQHLLAVWQLLGEHERTQQVIALLVGKEGQAQWGEHPDYLRWCTRIEALDLLIDFSDPGVTGRQLWQRGQRWAQKYLLDSSSPPLSPADTPRLKVGYLSSEWASASIALGYHGLFAYHAQEQQIQCYALCTQAAQRPGAALEPYFEAIILLESGNPSAVAASLESFDVVVDLSGWFHADIWPALSASAVVVKILLASNPPFFAPGTFFDAIVADSHVLSRARQRELSSRFIEQPSFFHWQPGPDLPQTLEAAQQKALNEKREKPEIRLGVVASRNKINRSSLRLWAGVLQVLPPNTQLTLKGLYYQDLHVQEQLRHAFAMAGGNPKQLYFEDNRDREDLYSFFLEQDIILDTTPYSGALSTCDAYWAGTPVMSLRSQRGIAESLHMNTQSSELLAEHPADFIARVLELVCQPAVLANYVTSLPAQLWYSPICQWASFGASMENLYLQLWKQKTQKKN